MNKNSTVVIIDRDDFPEWYVIEIDGKTGFPEEDSVYKDRAIRKAESMGINVQYKTISGKEFADRYA